MSTDPKDEVDRILTVEAGGRYLAKNESPDIFEYVRVDTVVGDTVRYSWEDYDGAKGCCQVLAFLCLFEICELTTK